MSINPFVELFRDPVGTLTAAAYVVLLVGMLVGTWWAAGRNALYLIDRWRDGWLVLVPKWYALRVVAMTVIVAIDLLLLAAIIYVIA